MRFQVGLYTCELSLDDDGEVVTTWRPASPLYLDVADRREMQARLQRQQDYYMRELNRGQTCSYNGSTIGGITNGTMTCQ
jgi:hypothetical protein